MAFLAFIPIIVTLVLMLVLNWSAKLRLLISWLLACVFGIIFWDIDIKAIFSGSLYGMLSTADVLIIITGAILLMNTLKASGATISMNLFSNLQYDTALVLALPTTYVIAMQCVGSAIGNMVCVNNAVAASATIGTTGKEGKLIKMNVIPMAIYLVVTALIFFIAVHV